MEVTRLLVECYFDIVLANLQDAVPKALMHFLVLRVQRGLQQHLIHHLYRCRCAPACVASLQGPSQSLASGLHAPEVVLVGPQGNRLPFG